MTDDLPVTTKQRWIVTNGREMKSWAPLTLNTDLGWNVIAGPNLDERMTLEMLFHRVPWLYRGIDARASAVASMPFTLYRNDKEVDSSADWQNVCEVLPDPRRLLWLVEASLTLVNAAYLAGEKNRGGYVASPLKYLDPRSVKPKLDKVNGLEGFTRVFDAMNKKFYPLEGGEPCPIIYFFRADPFTEIGPGTNNSPAVAAIAAAQALFHKDRFIADYFERGAIKVTILAADTQDQKEAERLKGWWQEVIAGVKNAWTAFVVRAKSIVPTVIGGGLDDLKEDQLTQTMREDIATALGIPQSKLFTQAAKGLGGGGVKESDDRQFYTETIIPECWIIQDVLNDQVFIPLGYKIKFEPEQLSIFQEDETNRASSMKAFMDFLIECPTAEIALETAATFGYTLTDKLIQAINAWFEKKGERADALTANMAKPTKQPGQPQDAQQSGASGQAEPGQPEQGQTASNAEPFDLAPKSFDPVEHAALTVYKQTAMSAAKKDHNPAAAVMNMSLLSPEMHRVVYAGLLKCKTAEEVKTFFEAITPLDPVRALEDARKTLERVAALN